MDQHSAVKKIPLRLCKGCQEMKSKRELIRIVKSNTGQVSIDLTGKKNGRGVYICKDLECLKKARKTRRFEREFSCKIPEEIYEELENELRTINGQGD